MDILTNRRGFWQDCLPHHLVTIPWRHRELLLRLLKRSIEAEYKESAIGMAWALLTPLLTLMVYTFTFTVIFSVRWDVPINNRAEFAVLLYTGLIVLNFVTVCLVRGPVLMMENTAYIKKVMFPIEIIPLVQVGKALFHAGLSYLILLAVHVVFIGLPPATVVLAPLIFLPLAVMVAGASWLLSSIGVYLRDIGQVVGMACTMLMFLSPVFYPVSAVPERFQKVLYLNPLTLVIEQLRGVLLFGRIPGLAGLGWFCLAAVIVAWLCLIWFQNSKRGFADVV